MADQIDEINDKLLEEMSRRRTVGTHRFTIMFKGADGESREEQLEGQLFECFERLEDIHGVDLKHGSWVFGYKTDEGSLVIKASDPSLRPILETRLDELEHQQKKR